MSQISDHPARPAGQVGSTSSAHSKTIAAAVDTATRARAAEVAGAYLSNLALAAQTAAAKGAC
ncbi:hypothetical protein OG883_43585 [Streptomyces sp. NBC_01142]|uniref:hypothetical protein n=1 Tax=Streptomyces sp. NBC_01142 TaxID=2975865 RepID=UPI00224E1EEC|nr:hypothetical protein [Streptomyces sp. NBC_01142]MCX4826523.1 hypothetical protein [Streptomyces sp. NBC_01142]